MKHRIHTFAGSLRPGLQQTNLQQLAQQLTQEATEIGPLRAVIYVCVVSRTLALILDVEEDSAFLPWKTYFEESLGTGEEWKRMGKALKYRRNATLAPGLALLFNEQIEADLTLASLLPSSYSLCNRLEREFEVEQREQVVDEGRGFTCSWSRLTVCLQVNGTPGARWAAWSRIVSAIQEGRSIAGIVALCLRERAVWIIVEARKEDVEQISSSLEFQEAEGRSVEMENGLSPGALRFHPDESVELQLLSSERLLRVPLSVAQLQQIEQQSAVPYVPLCTLS